MRLFKTFLILILLASVSSSSLAAAQSANTNRLVVFGDSLLDNGNLYSMIKIPISPPYYDGHFSNGAIAPEYLQGYLAVKQGHAVDLLDYAIGGALTGEKNPYQDLGKVAFPVTQQIDSYLSKYQGFHPDDLILLDGGGNNFLFTLTKKFPYYHPSYIGYIGRDYQQILNTLAQHGAKHILIYTIPDVTKTPVLETRMHGPFKFLIRRVLSREVKRANLAIRQQVDDIKRRYPGIDIKLFDLARFFQDVLDHPERYPFKQQQACVPMVGGLTKNHKKNDSIQVCQDPEKHLFWDLVHPSTLAQQMMAKKMMALLYP